MGRLVRQRGISISSPSIALEASGGNYLSDPFRVAVGRLRHRRLRLYAARRAGTFTPLLNR
jgi:hypothetical protein